jgi:hypothetical protein
MVRKNTKQANNKMQQTRSGHSRWRPSLLILVLSIRLTDESRGVIPGQQRDTR